MRGEDGVQEIVVVGEGDELGEGDGLGEDDGLGEGLGEDELDED